MTPETQTKSSPPALISPLRLRPLALGLLAVAATVTSGCQLVEEKSADGEQVAVLEAPESDVQRAEAEQLRRQAELDTANAAVEAAALEAEAVRQQLAAAERQLEAERAEQRAAELRREEQALADQRATLAAERAAAEEHARQLAERERELAEREVAAQAAADAEAEAERIAAAEAAAQYEPASKPEAEAAPAPSYVETTLRPGTIIEIEIQETISSGTHRVGDTFISRVARDIYGDDGVLAVPAGSEIHGRVTESRPLKRIGGQASLGVEFTELVVPTGSPIALRASFVELGEDRRKDKKKIIGAAVAGAILGRILGGKGAGEVLAGAAVGAAAGAAVVANADGKEAEIPAGEVVGLVLEEVVTVTTEMTGIVEP